MSVCISRSQRVAPFDRYFGVTGFELIFHRLRSFGLV